MKKLILLFTTVFFVCGMNAQTVKKHPTRVKKAAPQTLVEKSGYTISGMIEGATDGDTIYLVRANRGFTFLDSTLVKSNKFVFKGNQKKPDLRFIVAMKDKHPVNSVSFILENANLEINMPKGKEPEVIGGHDNELWSQFTKQEMNFSKQMKMYWEVFKDTTKTSDSRAAAKEELEKLEGEQNAFHAKFIRDNIPSGISDMLLGYFYQGFDDATKDSILADMKEKCSGSDTYLKLLHEREVGERTAVGRKYVDIALNDPDGKPLKVSDFVGKNKITMIDFWASWCGPCRAEMPHFIKVYNEYKDKGFGVVGVSLDNNMDAWKKAIHNLGIPWPQMSDLKGWENEGASLYNVRAIPATVLIDQEGKIVARDLRGEELAAKLKELLK